MLLTIDAGNTNTNFALFSNGTPLAKWRLATIRRRTADEYAVMLGQLLQNDGIERKQIKNIIIASVVPEIMLALTKLCQNYFKKKPLIVGENVKIPVKVKTDFPNEVGADRIVNAVAAKKLYKKAAIIIDFGTATTFDVVSKSGDYVGGVIAPGINLSLSALQKAASKLPMVWIQKPAKVIGKNTKTAMQSGIYWGYIGLIEGIVTRIKTEMKDKPIVIATGGLAPMFAESTKTIEKIEPDLTLIGLNEIFKAQ
jgi:type III pantothenate kinase